jgi:hypothetical protein
MIFRPYTVFLAGLQQMCQFEDLLFAESLLSYDLKICGLRTIFFKRTLNFCIPE